MPDFANTPALVLDRQQRNLLLLRPLFELALKTRHADAGGETLFAGLDTNYLAMALLDFVMEGSVLGLGRSLNETVAHVADLIRRMRPALGEPDARRASRQILDTLHNAAGKFERFEYEYYDAAAGQTRRYAFILLRYERAEDDQYYYRVSDEGFLVYLGMLDLGAADMQALMEKLLHELVRRGRVDEAMDVSRQAYLQAARYFETIRSRLDRAARVPDSVTWTGDLEPFLNGARQHLDDRQSDERQLLGVVTDKLREGDDPTTRANLVRLKDTVETELHLGSQLLRLVGEAGQRYLRTQAAMFRARMRQNLPDLEETLLPSLLTLSLSKLGLLATEHGHVLFAPAQPKVYTLGDVVELLLEPQSVEPAPDEARNEIVRLEELPPHFSPDDVASADHFLRQTFAAEPAIDIEAVLAAADQAGLRRQVRELMTFRMFQAFSREESPFAVDAHADGRFACDLVEGTRLRFTRRDLTND